SPELMRQRTLDPVSSDPVSQLQVRRRLLTSVSPSKLQIRRSVYAKNDPLGLLCPPAYTCRGERSEGLFTYIYEISPVDNNKHGGLARVATLIKQERARSPHSLFLLAGDFISPSLASGE